VLTALQNGTIDGMLAGIPVLTPLKFYDAAKPITEIHPAIVASTVVVNKKWFDALPADVRSAIVEVGAAVDKEAYGFASALVERANKGWVANGGRFLRLPAAEQAKMMGELKALGGKLLAQNPLIKAEYDELLKVVEKTR
jgi:TRAP-type C4-dicarboxylate transport system substrate-binding protein